MMYLLVGIACFCLGLAELVLEPLYVLTIGETYDVIKAIKEALCTTK